MVDIQVYRVKAMATRETVNLEEVKCNTQNNSQTIEQTSQKLKQTDLTRLKIGEILVSVQVYNQVCKYKTKHTESVDFSLVG